MSEKCSIQILPSHVFGSGLGLLNLLEGILPVKFTNEPDDGPTCSGQLLFEDQASETGTRRVTDQVRLTVPRPKTSSTANILIELNMRFADDADVPFPFRGRSVLSKVVKPDAYLQRGGDEKVLASSEYGPMWVVSTGNGPKRYRSAFKLPAFPPDRILQDVLNGDRFIEILPLLHFLQEVRGDQVLEGPPLRACFIFDDPNLHWPRYGFVDFKQITAHADKENYHVSFATIPLDTWFTHRPTAHLFRNNAARLSLCIHGNNHVREELARDYTQQARVSLLKQAVQRMERLERHIGVRVCRVMVPPHGACTEEMLAELPRCGFEAACISHGSLRAYNKSKSWTQSLGLAPSELVQGCPILPRWAVSGNTENTILLAAFLRQPMILRGHHQDLRDGIEVLDKAARFINSLGQVSWSNLTGLSRSNFQSRVSGITCKLKPLGRKVAFQTPTRATQLTIESAGNGGWSNWKISGVNGVTLTAGAEQCVSLPSGEGRLISVESEIPAAVASESISSQSAVPAFLRRILTEGRDRLLSRWKQP